MVSPKDNSDHELVRLDNQLCFMLYACSRAMTKAYQPLLKRMGLTYPQYLVMMVLWQWHDESVAEPTVSALGERLQLDSGTLTPLLKRLEKSAIICRRRDVGDERKVFISATVEGLRLRSMAEEYLQQRRGALADLDVPMIRSELGKLLTALSKLNPTDQG